MSRCNTSLWCEIGPPGGRIKCHPDPPAGGPGTMIVDRYAPVNRFEIVPQRAMAVAPQLRELDRLLDAAARFQRVKTDLSRRRPPSRTRGRHSPPRGGGPPQSGLHPPPQGDSRPTRHFLGDPLGLGPFFRPVVETGPPPPHPPAGGRPVGPPHP